MIHLEHWFRYGVTLSKDKQALLEMLERGLIDPQDFAQRWKRLQTEHHAGWLKVDPDDGSLYMTGQWLAAHAAEIEELQLRRREFPVELRRDLVPHFGPTERRRIVQIRSILNGLEAMLTPGTYLYVDGTGANTEDEFDVYFHRILEEAREWARRIHVAQQEVDRASEPQVNEIMDLLGVGRGRRQ